jgi:hypothetical protein
VTSAARRFRLAALLAAGALAVHELRYALAYGEHAGREASAQGHAYLTLLMPVVVLAALFAAAQALCASPADRRAATAGATSRACGSAARWRSQPPIASRS